MSTELDPFLGVIRTDNFSEAYPIINNYLFNKVGFQESRDGETREILDFKTILDNPYRRCVGGYKRDINIFFLLAEAMWIFTGKKDVSFLNIFNKRMANFSDDGKVFHAPYGFRLRHWGIRSEDRYVEENLHAAQGYDQISDAIKMLSENPDTRQVVLSIWNPSFDLGTKTKDIPCNDIIMLKIRDGKLITTIQNRSNDLHWGLPTNIFQFSFLTELIANCLGVELGTQTHNSQSLHIYDWNEIAPKMDEEFKKHLDALNQSPDGVVGKTDLYEVSSERRIDFKFHHEVAGNRLREIDYYLNLIIDNLIRVNREMDEDKEAISELRKFSLYLYCSYQLCKIYLQYKEDLANASGTQDKDAARVKAISKIEVMESEGLENWDIMVLAKNFFAARLSNFKNEYLGKL